MSLDNGAFFDSGNSSGSYMQFKRLVSCRDIFYVSINALHLIELLQLGHIDMGAVDTGLKFKSHNQRYFIAKKKDTSPVGLDDDGNTTGKVYAVSDI